MDQRLVGEEAGVVNQELAGKIVHPIDDDIIVGENCEGVRRVEPLFIKPYLDVGINGLHLLFSRYDLGATDIARMMQNLPLKIGQIDNIAIDEADGPDSRRRKI